jgi:hypothetical protein
MEGIWGPQEVRMTKHRTITGVVAVALLAIAATATTMKSHWPLTDRLGVSAGAPSFDERWVEVAKLPTEGLTDQSQALVERAKALSEKDAGQSQ